MKHVLASSLALFFLAACFGKKVPLDAQIHLSPGDSRVGTFVSEGPAFFTSTYWIEGPQGLILIDTQFLPSDAEKAVNWAEHVTGKKVVLAIVLHPNPDKFNGTAILQKRGIRVVTSDQVKALIPQVHAERSEWFYETYKPDYPLAAPVPESFGASTRIFEAAGTQLKLHVLGKGCSEAHVVVEWNGHIFPGDLVTNGFHSWLELGYIDDWRNRISEIRAMNPSQIHPGRGHSDDADLLDRQAAYLEEVIEAVKAEKPKGKSDPRALQRIQAKIEAAHPDYRFTKFVENGLEALWKRYAK